MTQVRETTLDTIGAVASKAIGRPQYLPEAIETYLQWHQIEGHTVASLRSYRAQLRSLHQFLEDGGHPLALRSIQPFDLMGWMGALHRAGNSPASVRTRIAAARSFFGWCVNWGLLESDPTEKISLPKVPRKRKPFLTKEQFNGLLATCDTFPFTGDRDKATLWLFITTGIRGSELADLSLDDLDWKRGLIRVRNGKGQKERLVPFHPEAQKAVFHYLKIRQDDSHALWANRRGQPLKASAVRAAVNRIWGRAKLHGKDAQHIFRRTWAANAVRQGVPRQYIQAIAGWSTPRMLDDYTAAMMNEERAIEEMKRVNPLGF